MVTDRIKAPCKDCTKRTLGCHDRCLDYGLWKKQMVEDQKAKKEYFEKCVRRMT